MSMTRRKALLIGKKISTGSLMTMMALGLHRLKKPDGTNVSMPEGVDILMDLLPNAEDLLPKGYKIVHAKAAFRKFIDNIDIELDEDNLPEITEPPVGLSGIEAIMWREIGPMAPKACAFLYVWLTTPQKPCRAALDYSGLTHAHTMMLCRASSVFGALYELVRSDVLHARHMESIDEIYRRGTEGVTEDVFGSMVNEDGKNAGTGVVGTKKVYSDKLLVKAVEAEDPKKYGKEKEDNTGVMFVMNVGTLNLAKPEEVTTAASEDVKDIEDAEITE